MKRVIIVHGWYGRPDLGWMNWLNKELSSREIEVIAPNMPDPDFPKIDSWVSYLQNIIPYSELNEEVYFIGHSIGCQTIIRYLEASPESSKIGGAVFVAGWLTLKNLVTEEEKEVSEPWLNTPINFDKVKGKIGKSFAVFSEDDPYVPVSNTILFKDNLNAETMIENRKGHYVENEIMKIGPVLDKVLGWM